MENIVSLTKTLLDEVKRIYLTNSLKSTSMEGEINPKELVDKILSTWEEHHMYDEELVKNVLLIMGLTDVTDEERKVDKIYFDMVDENLIKDPNLPIGASGEPIYILLPDDNPKYFDYNLKVIGNPEINWQVYVGGANPFGRIIFSYNDALKSDDKALAEYYHDAIMKAINSSCSLFKDKFLVLDWSQEYKTKTTNYDVLKNSNANLFNDIYDYLLTDEGFFHQIELYDCGNWLSNEVIAELREKRKNDDSVRKVRC